MRTDKCDDSGVVGSSKLVAVITGADGTIGSELLRCLLALDFNVFAVGLYPPTNHFQNLDNLHFIKCDLGNINEVFAAVESIQLSSDRIDLLILNAAMFLSPKIGWLPYRREMIIGAQIIERHLAVNVLADAQLFASLSQRLEQSVLSSGRAIFVSSCSARAGDLSLLLKKQDERFWCRHLNGYKSYADSKLLLSAYVQYLNKVLRSRDSQISVASVHPGVVPGKFYKNVFWPFRCFINWILAPFMRTPLQAATQILDVAFSPSLGLPNNSNNLYYENGVPSKINALQNQENIWLYGRCVREMIVDNDEESVSFNINTGNFDENSKQNQLEKSSAEFFERLLSEAGAI
uniref:SDR family NAD(P)-dependent oxidoreductase n=1 Tax=Meloidogyne incognita TaxID=6306 RepID=A0A914LLI8_MELIC